MKKAKDIKDNSKGQAKAAKGHGSRIKDNPKGHIKDKPRIVILRGLPGSGKRAYAERLISESDSMARVSLRDIRDMLGSNGKGQNEHVIAFAAVKAMRAVIELMIGDGISCVIDGANMNGYWTDFAKALRKKMPLAHAVRDMRKPLMKCISNLQKEGRNAEIPEAYNMALLHGLAPKPEKGMVLVAMRSSISESQAMSLLDHAKAGKEIAFASPLPESRRREVEKSLAESGAFRILPVNTLIMEWTADSEKLYFPDASWISDRVSMKESRPSKSPYQACS
jgi:predicted kinase